jgi:hypothetical protein
VNRQYPLELVRYGMPIDIQWSLAGVVAIAVLVVAYVIARRWLGDWGGTAMLKSAARTWWRRPSVDDHVDDHIEAQWTDGRLRLDTLLALLRKLEASLEQEIEKFHHLDPATLPPEGGKLKKVRNALRRFAFGKHLRDECRTLIALLQFCARDLSEFQGRDMSQKLNVLAEIQAAIEAVDRI